MTLTADQLENLIENASNADYTTDGNMAACDAARRDLAAMRQPITAEALTAAGWVEDTGEFGGVEYTHALNSNERVAVWFANDAPVTAVISMERHFYPKGVANMYALGQLVELLGGGA